MLPIKNYEFEYSCVTTMLEECGMFLDLMSLLSWKSLEIDILFKKFCLSVISALWVATWFLAILLLVAKIHNKCLVVLLTCKRILVVSDFMSLLKDSCTWVGCFYWHGDMAHLLLSWCQFIHSKICWLWITIVVFFVIDCFTNDIAPFTLFSACLNDMVLLQFVLSIRLDYGLALHRGIFTSQTDYKFDCSGSITLRFSGITSCDIIVLHGTVYKFYL